MIIPDANLLLYAYDQNSPFHQRAAAWWGHCMKGPESIGLCPVVIFAYLRLGTSPRLFNQTL